MSVEEFSRVLTRRFYSDDLGLEVDFDPFDAVFVENDTLVLLPTGRDEGWLNNYLNEISMNANVEIQRLHYANMDALRERYMRLLSAAAESVNDHLSTANEDNLYAQQRRLVGEKRDQEIADIQVLVREREADLQARWEKELEYEAQRAASDARAQYVRRNGRMHEREIARVKSSLEDEIVADYATAVREIDNRRREDARMHMDKAVNAALSVLAKQREEMLEEEAALYEHHRNAINQYLEDNRKNDIAWQKTMEEEHRQQEVADKVRNEMSERIRAQQFDFDSRKSQIESDMEDLKRRNEAALAEAQAAHDRALKQYKDENERLREREAGLLERYTELDERKSAEYARRIGELQDEKNAADERFNALSGSAKRGNYIWAALALVLAVATFCVGMLFGLSQSLDSQVAQANAATIFAWMGWLSGLL